VAGYNPDTDYEVVGLNHQDTEVNTTAKWIVDSGASTHMSQDAGLLRDMRPIRSVVGVGNGVEISGYGIGTVSLFVVLKDGSIKNVILKHC
jgi:hypothetical protein